MLAIELNEYDDDFFAALPKLLPYNLFTLKKLVKREIFSRRMELFNEEQEDHIDTIRTGIAETLPGQLFEHEQAKRAWEEEQKGKDQEAGEERKRMMEESMRQDQEVGTPEQGAGDAVVKSGTSPGGGEAKAEEHEGAFLRGDEGGWELMRFLRSARAKVEVPLVRGDEAGRARGLHDRGEEVGPHHREAVSPLSIVRSATVLMPSAPGRSRSRPRRRDLRRRSPTLSSRPRRPSTPRCALSVVVAARLRR